MAYTNAWSHTNPLGSVQASTIDDELRKVRLDVEERMGALVVDWTADPVVPLPPNSADNFRYIPFSQFLNDLHAKENDISTTAITAFVGNGPYQCGLSALLPANITLTRIKFWLNRNAATTVTLTLNSCTFGGSSAPSLDGSPTTLVATTGSNQTLDTGAITKALDPTKMYTFSVDATGMSGNSYSIYGVYVTFKLT